MRPWYFEESEFDGKLAELLGINILSFLLIIVTLGIGFSWAMCMKVGNDYKENLPTG